MSGKVGEVGGDPGDTGGAMGFGDGGAVGFGDGAAVGFWDCTAAGCDATPAMISAVSLRNLDSWGSSLRVSVGPSGILMTIRRSFIFLLQWQIIPSL